MEVLLGISLLPDGKRKSGMATVVQATLANYFEREAAGVPVVNPWKG